MTHAASKAAVARVRINGDESRRRVCDRCPTALGRLDVFYWEWISARDKDAQAWVRAKKKPITVETGVNEQGLHEAAEEVLRCVQQDLHEFHAHREPLAMDMNTIALWKARVIAITALDWMGGQQFAKEVEAQVSLGEQPLALCVGSTKREPVTIYSHGRFREIKMAGYIGCLRTFPDPPYGPGRRWPRLCPDCRVRRSNAKSRAKNELRRRTAAAGSEDI